MGVVFLAHALCFLLALYYRRIYMGDSAEYIYAAVNLRHLGILYSGNPALPIDISYLTQRPPLYPLFLGLVYSVQVNNWLVLVLQNLLSVANVLLARQIGLRLGLNRKFNGLFVVFALVYPAQLEKIKDLLEKRRVLLSDWAKFCSTPQSSEVHFLKAA